MLIAIEEEVAIGLRDSCVEMVKALKESQDRYEKLAIQVDRDRFMTIQEACEYLRCNEDTILYYRTRGLDYYKKGREAVWYRKGEIDDWLASGKVSRHQR